MRRVRLILREVVYLVKKEKILFLFPILIVLALLAFFAYQLGPTIIMTFIYAGI